MSKKKKRFIFCLLWLLLFVYMGTIAKDSIIEFWKIVPEVFSEMMKYL